MHITSCLKISLMAMLVIIASIAQFHHHDCDGNVIIHLTTWTDLSIGDATLGSCNHEHSDSHHQNCCNNEDLACSMHINVFKIEKKQTIPQPDYLPISFSILSKHLIINQDNIQSNGVNIDNSYSDINICIQKQNGIISTKTFRAPPTTC